MSTNDNGNGNDSKPIVIPIVPPSDRTSLSEGVIVPTTTNPDKK